MFRNVDFPIIFESTLNSGNSRLQFGSVYFPISLFFSSATRPNSCNLSTSIFRNVEMFETAFPLTFESTQILPNHSNLGDIMDGVTWDWY